MLVKTKLLFPSAPSISNETLAPSVTGPVNVEVFTTPAHPSKFIMAALNRIRAAVISRLVRPSVLPTDPPTVTVPVPALTVRLCAPFRVSLKLIFPPTVPVVTILLDPAAKKTGLLKVMADPFPATPITPPPPTPPLAVIVLAFNVTTEPPVELMPTVPALPPLLFASVEAPPEVLIFAKAMVPVVLVIATAPPALPTPALFAAPVVTKSPLRLIAPTPVAVMATAPESVPLLAAAAVLIVCATAKSTPPIPPVKVATPPAVSIPAFKSKVAPCRVTLVVAPVAVINPSTCTSPKVPLDRMVTGSWNVDAFTVTRPVCNA